VYNFFVTEEHLMTYRLRLSLCPRLEVISKRKLINHILITIRSVDQCNSFSVQDLEARFLASWRVLFLYKIY